MELEGIFKKKKVSWIFILAIFITNLSAISYVDAQSGLQMSFRRNFGLNLGTYINGDFTITGSGNDSIQELHLYFNGVEVANSSSNKLTFGFRTTNYSPGNTNITLIGRDSSGHWTQITEFKNFLSSTTMIPIILAVVIIVVIAIYFKYFRNRSKSVDKSS